MTCHALKSVNVKCEFYRPPSSDRDILTVLQTHARPMFYYNDDDAAGHDNDEYLFPHHSYSLPFICTI